MNKNLFKTKLWVQIALINFCMVALAGVTMRYKINFSLPIVDQKFLLYGHSHFAFVGWIAMALMILMVRYLIRNNLQTNYKKYHWILIAELLVSYAMFVSFILEGYALWSITFSTATILVSYFFIFFYWRDLNKIKNTGFSIIWLKAALFLWALSSLGAFMLAYLMANHIMVQDLYFSAVYFFMHFQYNGWFLFACFGVFFSYMHRLGINQISFLSKRLFAIMAITVIPTYFLSILWLNLPLALTWIADISGVLQLLVLIYFIQIILLIKKSENIKFSWSTKWLWRLSSIAFILKIILQMLSTIPFLSKYAFGFRPIVIGYLHLSFVGIISFFILGYINEFIHRFRGHVSGIGAIIFVIGFLVQEVILMLQGLEAMDVEPIKSANIILFYCAILMAGGLIWITTGIIRTQQHEEDLSLITIK
ncbi:MAG TPA: hypothetical protein VFQ86_06960 [Arachidicoccus soli]|nr:hypothetical protein [Arachidicoccus soli]